MDTQRIKHLLHYRKIFQNTAEDDWMVGDFHNECNTMHCALGHIENDYVSASRSVYSTSIFGASPNFTIPIQFVNDAYQQVVRENYPQQTPRARVLAYIDDEIAAISGCKLAMKKLNDLKRKI